ncbi:MAG TPA: hypothetical protein VGF94_29520 [Kofleriaceae bacterium]
MHSSRFVLVLVLAIAALAFACGKKKSSDGAAPSRSAKTAAAPPPAQAAPASQIAITEGNIYFKSADGAVKTWGTNDGLSGDGTQDSHAKPIALADLAGAARLAVSPTAKVMCAAMKDGTVKCWGDGGAGELGTGKADKSPKPVVVDGVAGAVDVVAGNNHVCALLGDGTVTCWGANSMNQASTAADKIVKPTPVAGVTGVAQVAAGGDTTCALGKDGSVKCWGIECASQAENDCAKPYTIASLAGATYLAGCWQGLCAVGKDGGVSCWGSNNDYGQLGREDVRSTDGIVAVKGLTGVKQLAGGQSHYCALMTDATVRCWGDNEYGQLGDDTAGKVKFRAAPAPVKGLAGVASLACADGTCCALGKGDALQCWGENVNAAVFGEANNSSTTIGAPVAIALQ